MASIIGDVKADTTPAPASNGSAAEREARIAARRKRVQERLAAIRATADAAANGGNSGVDAASSGGGGSGGGAAAPSTAASESGISGYPKAAVQIAEGQRRLLRLRHRTGQDVSAVRVAADEAEAAHRAADARARAELRARVADERERSATANAAIAAGWQPLLGIAVPEDLKAAIDRQQAACAAVIASKEAVAGELRTALRAKDDAYVRLLRRQAAEVDALLAAMAKQASEVAAAQAEELEAAEAALDEGRRDLVAEAEREAAAELAARAAAEAAFTERHVASLEARAGALEELRCKEADAHRALKARLEADVATLEQHLARMRAVYQLNAEKLEYNHRVLAERDAENAATARAQKRKLARQRDALALLKQKHAAAAAKHQADNARLAAEYRRSTEALRGLKAKLARFEAGGRARFRELWALRAGEARALTLRLLDASRTVAEQQLGWRWRAPDERALFASPHDGGSGGGGGSGSEDDAEAAAGISSSGGGGAVPEDLDAFGAQGGGGDEEGWQQLQQQQQRADDSAAVAAEAVAAEAVPELGTSGEQGDEDSGNGAARADSEPAAEADSGSAAEAGGADGSDADSDDADAEEEGNADAEAFEEQPNPDATGSAEPVADAHVAPHLTAPAAPVAAAKKTTVLRALMCRHQNVAALLCDAAGFLALPSHAALADGEADTPAGGSSGSGTVAAAATAAAAMQCDTAVEVARTLGIADDGAGFDGLVAALTAADGGDREDESGCSGAAITAGGPAAAPSAHRPRLVSPEAAVARLRQFVEFERSAPPSGAVACAAAGVPATGACFAVGSSGASTAAATAAAVAAGAAPRRTIEAERAFWERLPAAVGPAELRAWAALTEELRRYHSVLMGREASRARVAKARADNAELRRLLAAYAASEAHAALLVPPTLTVAGSLV